MLRLAFFSIALLILPAVSVPAQDEAAPHAVFVIGTGHYEPASTLPRLARRLKGMGFRSTMVQAKHDPEKNAAGLPGLEVLRDADVAVFFMRFLTLPEEQLQHITDYLQAGKPVVGFRTSTHAFAYPKSSPLAKWNDGFGKEALGSKYFIHLQGTTEVRAVAGKSHPILTGIDLSKPLQAAGTLYLAEVPADASVLLRGTGNSKRTGEVSNQFGTHRLEKTMTQDLAWTWTNRWGGRVFATTLGHPGTFANKNFVRLFVNGIHWAVGREVPLASVRVSAIGQGNVDRSKGEKVAKAQRKKQGKTAKSGIVDGKNVKTGKSRELEDPILAQYGIYAKTAPRPITATPVVTELPLLLPERARVAFVGNTLFDRARDFGYFETLLHQQFPGHEIVARNFTWPADSLGLQPRPANFADTEQHLTLIGADVIFAAYGFNESFAGPAGLSSFRTDLTAYLSDLRSRAFNGRTGPQIVLISPIANENVEGVAAADLNNANIKIYVAAMREVAAEQGVGFVDVFAATSASMASSDSDLTINGCHLGDAGYRLLAATIFKQVFGTRAPTVDEPLRAAVLEKSKQFFRRYRPVNTFYYTGGRNKSYGYLDFLPAMRNFEIMVANRDQRVWALARGETPPVAIDDSNVPPLPRTTQSRGANEWMSPADEAKAFTVDPRFTVNLFASEEEFPDIACPIQMRWDARGRMWVSCSTTYPHVYPGNEPDDKLVILEDTDGDGRADKSTVFADDLHIPLSFEFGDGGVYVSEEPHLSFIKDTDGDGKADHREKLLAGFGCEDSHHALHDFAWSPDGDLILRESIFHHTQVETPYGPIRQQNSGWFRFEPQWHRLTSFGTYPSTNPWGVTFDDWGQHVASHPIYAQAFHALDPQYPEQHPRPTGLRAYSGTCGQEFVDFPSWPEEMQGGFIKVRYKPSNRVEIHRWVESDHGYDEEYVSDLIFSKNLSFIPVDLRYGPRGAMYVCDWYNPIKGHAQYSLRDERRDRGSGRIWRIAPKDVELQQPPRIAGASLGGLLDVLKRREYRYRYWAKRELRERDPATVKLALDNWMKRLDPKGPRFRHHQMEGLWLYRGIDVVRTDLLIELLNCEDHHARAAATHQLRYWHGELDDGDELLRARANDPSGLVRMEAAIATSYVGTKAAFEALLDTMKHPYSGHLSYAIRTALGSRALLSHWKGNGKLAVDRPELGTFLATFERSQIKPTRNISARDAEFDTKKNLKVVKISSIKERMLFDVTRFEVAPGQPVRIEFTNPDATAHNIVIVAPGADAEVGMAATEMAKDPREVKRGQYVPKSTKVLFHTGMVPPDSTEALRFTAPKKTGEYPYICTFPGHWVIMRGVMVVK